VEEPQARTPGDIPGHRLPCRPPGEGESALGHGRIHGELIKLGVTIAPSTVWEILHAVGIDPAPRRSRPSWQQFLHAQAGGIVAVDFLHVDTVLLRRLYVLVFIRFADAEFLIRDRCRRALVIEDDAAPAWGPLSHAWERASMVPAMLPAIGPIKINMWSDLVFSGGRSWVRTSDPSLVRHCQSVGYCRSPGNLASHVTRSIGECRMSLWSTLVVSPPLVESYERAPRGRFRQGSGCACPGQRPFGLPAADRLLPQLPARPGTKYARARPPDPSMRLPAVGATSC
jgi:hypothetical protein